MKLRSIALLLAAAVTMQSFTACVAVNAQAPVAEELAVDPVLAQAAEQLMGGHSETGGKEETVYVIANADGSVEKTIVSAWLKNEKGDAQLADATTLKDIANVKTDGGYTENGDGTILWQADGQDVYYRGTTDQALPVEVSVSYRLNGAPISADALQGATGHLTITFTYQNNTARHTTVNGKAAVIYQPFTMVSGTLLDNQKASNITVTNGQAINSGDRTVVVGLAMPGLSTSLGLDDLKNGDGEPIEVDLPESITIEADVTDFEPVTILTVGTNSALEKLGLSDVDSLDDLKQDVEKLKDATRELMDGAKDLNNGVSDLNDGTKKLDDGVNDLNDGARKLNDGAADLLDGTTKLYDGTQPLKEGTAGLVQGATQLNDGINSAKTGADTLKAGAATLNAAVQGIGGVTLTDDQQTQIASGGATAAQGYADTMASTVCDSLAGAVTAQQAAIAAAAKANAGSQATADAFIGSGAVDGIIAALEATGMTNEEAKAAASSLITAVAATVAENTANTAAAQIAGSLNSDGSKQTVSGGLSTALGQLGGGIASATASSVVNEVNTGLGASLAPLAAATQQLADGSANLADGLGQLSGGSAQLKAGAIQLDDGMGTLRSGAAELNDGAKKLKDGTGELYDGTSTMDSSMVDLVDGVKKLLNGTNDLVSGVDEYNRDGIEKLTDVLLNDLDGTWQRLKAVQDYSEEYSTFSGALPGTESSVKFVYSIG